MGWLNNFHPEMKFLPERQLAGVAVYAGLMQGPAPPVSEGFAGGAILSGNSPPAKTASSELRIFGLSELRKAPLSPELKRLNGKCRMTTKKKTTSSETVQFVFIAYMRTSKSKLFFIFIAVIIAVLYLSPRCPVVDDAQQTHWHLPSSRILKLSSLLPWCRPHSGRQKSSRLHGRPKPEHP